MNRGVWLPDLRILASHPVQYQAPLFRALVNEGIEIEVGFYHKGAAFQGMYDAEFGRNLSWDVDLLAGYPYRIFGTEQTDYGYSEQLRAAPGLLSWVLSDRRTPLLLFGWVTELFWLAWLLRTLGRAPVMMLAETTAASFAANPKPAWRVGLLRWLLQRTSACLFIGRHNRAFLLDMGVSRERLFQTPYSIDNAHFAGEAKRLLPRRQVLCRHYGLDPVLPTFLFAGKWIPKKRPVQLLQAYLVAGLQTRAQLVYVGDGKLRGELERLVSVNGLKHVHLLGFLNQSQMPLAYVLGEVLCLLSGPTETWGLVVNEALACSRPVIASDAVGCVPDLVGPENGWVVPLDDSERLVQTLLDAYNQRAAWAEMGHAGRERVRGHTFEAMAGGIRVALQHVLDGLDGPRGWTGDEMRGRVSVRQVQIQRMEERPAGVDSETDTG